ncbi:winged helix-turn-helix domain-containing protein [Acinetobacter rongchengensis]|uniref:Winged helix-turn-helix domain-containing protein n=1 Tax=Acinetobacter rongchengensis TaxID=2419601 RepID=A0A3A8FIC1_9GAMM|nr:crosslink repair DNA glycosylase YcaQ family protein [Acinetobacter rongchengensis]RKG40881.1 winged helix-turn-helix domain-containing protein [Acinetobacter rongchengensis]
MIELLRRLALHHQGLMTSPSFGNGLSATLQCIEHLGYVQVDTISVVERAHHHILWSRVVDYEQNHLNLLIQQKKIFEYWYHAASYLPIQDYRYALPRMAKVRDGQHQYFSSGDQRLMNEILVQAKAEGKIRLRDIGNENKTNTGGWWNSSLARRSIEQLFMQGDLMISERIGMEKIYSPTESCLPNGLDLSMPTLDEYALYLFNTTLRAHGVFTLKQLLHLKTGKDIRDAMHRVLNHHLEEGVITSLKDIDGQNYYVNSHSLNQILTPESKVKILSPFDNLVIHRDRLNALFKFDYRIECYVPATKRIYGYFCLPILYADQLVGRIDCKAHRSKKVFEILSLHLENNIVDQAHFFDQLKIEIHKFAKFNQCPKLHENTLTILNNVSLG